MTTDLTALAVALYRADPPLSYVEIAQFLGLKIAATCSLIAKARKADPTIPYRTREQADYTAAAGRAIAQEPVLRRGRARRKPPVINPWDTRDGRA